MVKKVGRTAGSDGPGWWKSFDTAGPRRAPPIPLHTTSPKFTLILRFVACRFTMGINRYMRCTHAQKAYHP
eukprot:3366731-Pyramimonas_sp.AAC.1